jgi:hypothetical protein
MILDHLMPNRRNPKAKAKEGLPRKPLIDCARTIEDIVPAQHRWLFTRKREEGLPLLALHPKGMKRQLSQK